MTAGGPVVVGVAAGLAVLLLGPASRPVAATPPAGSAAGVRPSQRALLDARPRHLGLALAAVVAAVGLAVGSPLLVGPAALAAAGGGRAVEVAAARRSAQARRGEVVALVDALTRSVRSGATLAGAVEEAARDDRLPGLGADLRRLRAQLGAGQPLPIALDRWAARTGDPDLRLLAGTVAVLAAAGGAAGPALDATARTLRARVGAAAEVRALAAQARASAVLLVAAPAAFAVALAAVDPRLAAFFLRRPAGAVCAAAALVLDAAALLWMQRIIDEAGR